MNLSEIESTTTRLVQIIDIPGKRHSYAVVVQSRTMGGRGKSSNPSSHKNGHITAKPKTVKGKKHRNENKERREIPNLSTAWNKGNIGYGLVVAVLGKFI